MNYTKKYLKKLILLAKQYKELRNKVNNMISNAKKSYYQLKCKDNAGNSKTTWKLKNEIIFKRVRDIIILNI